MILVNYAISVVGWIFVIIGISVYFKRKSKTNLVYPVQGFIFMELFTAWFSSLMIWFLKEEESVVILFMFFILSGIIGIVSFIHKIIEYDDTGFWVWNFFWQKKRYEYKDIQYIKRKTVTYGKYSITERRTTIFMPKRKIRIEQEYKNYFEFMELMAKVYKKVHHKKIPDRK